jgi:hypothetical protein
MGAMPQATSKLLQPTLKKGFHIHYFNPTNPKPQPNPKTKPKSQPEKEVAHRKHSLQQLKQENSPFQRLCGTFNMQPTSIEA